ncbi:polyphosphate kinase 1 [Alkalibacter rhizosphaerae]|uniref:Polyphosphate kinase n=1 Tax=Alkalibacter rhizosphaerae TaxID=2815577 RepID=A0A974XNJ0_9FIRM|nr:polyphosphate kinase 1 [Alkalibacter rhizosphaerae]QSX09121.1 polyphosphate kinase 1 [Alkalibacter rhizosphaerae]
MSKNAWTYDTSYTQNRELSWLRFNQRVMEEAEDPTVPLLERLKFLAIFNSNLDEFFMIRVGSLLDLSHIKKDTYDNKTGWTPKEQLQLVFRGVRPLYEQRDLLYEQLKKSFHDEGIHLMTMEGLDGSQKKRAAEAFRKNILPLLSPQIIDAHHPFPHLWNKALYITANVKYKGQEPTMGIVPVPAVLPGLLELPGEGICFIRSELVILHYLEEVFPGYEVADACIVTVTRNADIHPEDEAFDFDQDFRNHMKQILKKRSKLAPVRLEVEGKLEKRQSKLLLQRLDITEEQVYSFNAPISMHWTNDWKDKLPAGLVDKWTYESFESAMPSAYQPKESMLLQVQRKDMLLFFPYDSMEPFIHLLKESVNSSKVQSIKITIYRLAPNSRIIEYLSEAAENGKEVTVLIELRARFDEKNNIAWAERLEEAGCKVIYGVNDCKVHSKICLITMVDKGKISHITQIGTGNYNEQTAKLYTDLSLLTADAGIGRDAAEFFKNMSIANLGGTYKHLLVAPEHFQKPLLELIDEEIKKTRQGSQGKILFKMNSLTEREIIDKLSQASNAGVEIILMIRGICCLLPGIPGKTENIRVVSIVGRFLEHPRIYCFGSGKSAKLYISSADLMTRNMHRRVEIGCPVLDSDCRKRIVHILEAGLKDNVKSRELNSAGIYKRPNGPDNVQKPWDSQNFFMKEAASAKRKSPRKKRSKKVTKWKIFKHLLKKWVKQTWSLL